jgi:adenylyltransferase/sulfurtransferase
MLEKFTEEEIRRYARHIVLPEVGGVGQARLRSARVLIVGAGGLGSPAAIYLAAAGVGTIGIVDDDAVELSNLHRQILHNQEDLGRPKVQSAREMLEALNPLVRVETHPVRLRAENVEAVIEPYDVIIDGSDNFPTKFLLNDACIFSGKPLCLAGIHRFEAQVMTILKGQGPCYRCIFIEPPPAGAIPSCEEAGVLGAVAGLAGCLQALEALKVLLGLGQTLAGSILRIDALRGVFRRVEVNRNPRCPVCSKEATIKTLVDYSLACGEEP